MSVISNAAADGFIEREAERYWFYLVHGPDEGLTHERSKAIARKVRGGNDKPLSLLRLDGDVVAREPGALADEAYAISMFGGHRVIWIDAQRHDILREASPLFERPPTDCTLIVRAGPLKRDNAFRQAVEKMADGASVECYPDEQASLSRLIDSEARAAGIAIAPDARTALLALLGADRETTRGEIAKLMLYALGKPRIELEDLEAIVSGAAPSNLERVIDRSLAGDLREAAASAAQFFNEGGDGEQLMARLIAQFMLLFRLRMELDRSQPLDASSRPPSFVKLPPSARRALSRQSEAWTSEAIARRLPAIETASAGARARPRLTRVLAIRALWALATSAAKGQAPSR
ncbi:MAG TPA: DNA polymerase III subunit delta [Roseiarcus sp.]|nr:DNA polymerase III subunit delta [Roseiarcus sp.]